MIDQPLPSKPNASAAFREQYVEQISPWYNGLVHIGVMYAAGIAAIGWCVSQHARTRPGSGCSSIPVAIAGNFVEWGMHQFVMHRLIDVFALRAIYDRHTRQHHQYFTDNDPTIDTMRGIPHRLLPVARAGGARGARRPARLARRAADQRQRRLRRLHHDDRPLHGLRDLPLLLPRAARTRSCATCRSSTRSAATTPRITTWGS